MKQYLRKVLICGSVAFLFLVFTPAHAQVTQGLQMQPAIIEDKVNPGDIYRFTVKVTNIADDEKTLYLSAQDITGIDSGGVPEFAEEGERTPYEISSWITLPDDIIVLGSEASRDVTFTVRVPADATPGSHFGGVFFESKPQQTDTTGAAVGARVGTVINLRIAGDITEEVVLREFSTDRFLYDAPPVEFTMNIENRGNTLARPHGGIEITDMFGKKVATVEVNNAGAAVFPGGEREYAATWEQEGLVFGRYNALLNIVYGDEGRQTVVRPTSFWVLPLKPVSIALGAILGSILLLYLLVKRHITRRLRQMGASDTAIHAQRYNKGMSRLAFVAVGIACLGVIILVLLFTMFA